MADEGNYRKILRVGKIDFLVLSRKIKSLKSRLDIIINDIIIKQ